MLALGCSHAGAQGTCLYSACSPVSPQLCCFALLRMRSCGDLDVWLFCLGIFHASLQVKLDPGAHCYYATDCALGVCLAGICCNDHGKQPGCDMCSGGPTSVYGNAPAGNCASCQLPGRDPVRGCNVPAPTPPPTPNPTNAQGPEPKPPTSNPTYDQSKPTPPPTYFQPTPPPTAPGGDPLWGGGGAVDG